MLGMAAVALRYLHRSKNDQDQLMFLVETVFVLVETTMYSELAKFPYPPFLQDASWITPGSALVEPGRSQGHPGMGLSDNLQDTNARYRWNNRAHRAAVTLDRCKGNDV
jgi:hypothetical protein